MEQTQSITNERLTALEMKVSYLEDFLNQVQEVAVENSKLMEKLKKENRILAQRLKELSEDLEGDIPNRKPPHY